MTLEPPSGAIFLIRGIISGRLSDAAENSSVEVGAKERNACWYHGPSL